MKQLFHWLISLTWGAIMTIIGIICTIILCLLGYKPTKYGYGWYFVCGTGWGGVSFGPIAVISEGNAKYPHTRKHEMGHSFQNAIWGPLFIFVIAIPSLVRCGYYNYLQKHNKEKYKTLPEYDSIWFEGQATKWGYAFSDKYLQGN